MESLYVCLFSNGQIKVGRSNAPQSRIANHADRVAVMGVELVDWRSEAVEDDVESRERILIARCEAKAAQKFKNEWFVGLDFAEVCQWAAMVACENLDQVASPVRYVRQRLGMTQAELAVAIGCTQGNIGFIERGQTLMPDLAKRLIRLAHERGLTVTYEELYGDPLA